MILFPLFLALLATTYQQVLFLFLAVKSEQANREVAGQMAQVLLLCNHCTVTV